MKDIVEMEYNCQIKGFEVVERGLNYIMAKNQKKRQSIICTWDSGWEHVSINGRSTPTWDEMCRFKEMFWRNDEVVVQFHPAEADYVNNLEHCLHLWRPIEQYVGKMPVPPAYLVGIKGIKLKEG